MSADFNKGNTRGISGAGEAVTAYFEHFQRKYPKQIEDVERHIQEAAGKGIDAVGILLIDHDHCRVKKRPEIRAFNEFLDRYLEYLGYQLTVRKTLCWENRGRHAQSNPKIGDLKYLRKNSTWVGTDDGDYPNEIFICDRRDAIMLRRMTIRWSHNF